PNTLNLDLSQTVWKPPTDSKELHFIQLVSKRLSTLQFKTTEFLEKLDNEIQKVSDFFVKESNSLVKKGEQHVIDSESKMLESIIKLEKFVLLSYTGLVKILKKHDKHSGLNIGEAYLYRIVSLPLTKSESLLTLKKYLMEKIVQGISPNAITTTNINNGIMTESNNYETFDATTAAKTSLSPSLGTTLLPNLLISKASQHSSAAEGNWFPPSDLLPHQKVIASLTGPHGTDIIGSIFECMAKHDCEVEDFMLSRLYHNVTFGVLITLNSDNIDLFRDLAEASRKWDGTLSFDIHDSNQSYFVSSIEDAPYENRIKYTATVLNQKGLTPQFLNDWTKFLLKEKISVEKMQRLNEGKLSCADYKLSVPVTTNFERLRQELFILSTSHGTDVAIQPYDVFRRHKRLVVFDMDSTLIQQEVIDEIARHAGVVNEVASITELAMNGEIDFKESLKRRVSLLKGTPVKVLNTVQESLTFTEGARFLCKALKKIGFKLAVISGGFIPLAKYVKNELGLDYAFANQLKVSSDGLTLTGETVGPIVDAERKAELLEVIAQAENVTLEQVIAVGDGANDLLMLAKSGLGIAFNAKPRVQEKARARINQKSLKYVLYLLGYTDEDAKQLYSDY
ncbi:15574_t:CDS:2, partial [Funneliformis caledonium]